MNRIAATGQSPHALIGQSPVFLELKQAMDLRTQEERQLLDVLPKIDPHSHRIIDTTA